MHPYYPFVNAILPNDLARIVIEYAALVVRPFKKRQCVICGDKHRRSKSNLCKKHSKACPVCFGYLPQSRDKVYCRGCEIAHPWLFCMRLGSQAWETLYKDGDCPRDLIKLDIEFAWIKPLRDQWGAAITKLDHERTKIGEIRCSDTLRRVKENRELRKKTCEEFWLKIPKLLDVLNRDNGEALNNKIT